MVSTQGSTCQLMCFDHYGHTVSLGAVLLSLTDVWQRLLDITVIYKLRPENGRRIFPDVSVPIRMEGPGVSGWERWGGVQWGKCFGLWVRVSLTQTLAMKWWMGYGGKSGGERIGRGGGKMCSDESKEWNKKGVNEKRPKVWEWMQGLDYVALKSQKDKGGSGRRITTPTVSGIFGMCTSSDI